jgi:hypothetical protein
MNGTMTMDVNKPASPKQLKWLKDLLEKRDYSGAPADWIKYMNFLVEAFAKCEAEGYTADSLNVWLKANGRKAVTHNAFQTMLKNLQTMPMRKAVDSFGNPEWPADQLAKIANMGAAVELEDGIYKVGNAVFKVKHSQTGKQWAYELVLEEPDCGGCANDEPCGAGCKWKAKFVYAGAPKKFGIKPEHKLTYEQAKEFGALYGTCIVCGKLLTNELSVMLGIGPVCGRRQFGGEFKFLVDEAKQAIIDGTAKA